MLILRTSTASPFGRKVRMAVGILGLTSQVGIVHADTSDPNDTLRQQNPLGKIPTLMLENGEALFDSRVIVEHLDALDGRDILIPKGADRIGVLRDQALADGLMDAAILQMYEIRFRPPTHHVEAWLAHQRGKVDRALDFAANRLPSRRAAGPHIGEIALAAALGYLDYRFDGRWRATHPALKAWLADFAGRVPVFAETAP
jgi:glutathione S-transferase